MNEPARIDRDRVVILNGDPVALAEGTTIADLVTVLLDRTELGGIAVAVDRCVIPRSEWSTTLARPDTQVEVVTAAAGG
jgi:sulfur carrier protein